MPVILYNVPRFHFIRLSFYSLLDWGYTLTTYSDLWVIFVYVRRYRWKFFFFFFYTWRSNCSRRICWKDCPFSTEFLSCGIFVKNQLVLPLLFIYTLFLTHLPISDFCGSTVSLEICYCVPPNLILFQNCFGYSKSLHFHMESACQFLNKIPLDFDCHNFSPTG